MVPLLSGPKWHYWTQPNVAWIESFATNLVSPDVAMWPEDVDGAPELYAWSSMHLNDVTTPAELADRTASLKALFDGAMYISRGPGYRPFGFKGVEAAAPADAAMLNGRPDLPDVRAEPFSSAHLTTKHGLDDKHLKHAVTRYLFLARYDDIVKAVLKYTGVQGLSYVTLYAFRDWMNVCDWDDKRIALEAGWSGSELKDFKNTANNPAFLGPYSRHGGAVTSPPKRPMGVD